MFANDRTTDADRTATEGQDTPQKFRDALSRVNAARSLQRAVNDAGLGPKDALAAAQQRIADLEAALAAARSGSQGLADALRELYESSERLNISAEVNVNSLDALSRWEAAREDAANVLAAADGAGATR